MKTANHRLIGNLISARSFIGKVTEKAGPRAAMAALGPAFRPVLALVTGDEVHPQSSVARITQDQARKLPANDASGRLLRRTVSRPYYYGL